MTDEEWNWTFNRSLVNFELRRGEYMITNPGEEYVKEGYDTELERRSRNYNP